MSHDVFISFAFKDRKIADCIRAYLEENGVKCFMCTDMPGGVDFDVQLGEAIRQSRLFLLVFSTHADESESVRAEMNIAKTHKITRIPVRIEDRMPNKLAYLIGAALFFDAFPPPLEKYLPKLAEDINTLLNQSKTPEASSQPKPGTGAVAPSPKLLPDRWYEIDYKDLNAWVKDRIKVLNSGKQLAGRTFIYRKNRYTGKYERKLKTL